MAEPEYLEFYRIDVSAPMRRVLIPSVLLVMFGASMVCFSAAVHGSQLLKPIAGFLGAVGILTGFPSAIVGMSRLLKEDAYVGVVEDGLVHSLLQGLEDWRRKSPYKLAPGAAR